MTTPAQTRSARSRSATPSLNIALIAVFAALIAVFAIVPGFMIGPVPFVLTIVIVLASPLIVGPLQGVLAAALYMAVGLMGLPVFAGGASGIAVFLGPTGGYLVGYAAAAIVAGLLGSLALRIGARPSVRVARLGVAAVGGLAAIHACGVAGLMLNAGMDFTAALTVTAGFVPLDLVKAALAAMIAAAALRAFPRLDGVRR